VARAALEKVTQHMETGKLMKSDTKARKAKRGKRLSDSRGHANATVIHALQEIYQDKTLKQVITSLSRWSAQITGRRGIQPSYICSADGVTVRGRGWQLSIGNISSLTTEGREYRNLKLLLDKLIRLETGKR